MKIEKFYLIVPIGIEEAAKQELESWSSVLALEFGADAFVSDVQITKGGIEFQIGEQVGLLLNHCLKLPSRLLQRVHSFTTREWSVVEKELKTVAWKSYFPQGITEWEIAASESKMNNEKHLSKFLAEKFEGRAYQISPQGATAYLRVHDNVFTISRDTSGEHLHFRGYRKLQGEAPLRENFAAFLWSVLIEGKSRSDLEKVWIIDPFAGSGTLLIEAWHWNRLVSTRSFACDRWITKDTLQKIQKVESRLNQWSLKLVGIDTDADVLQKARSNGRILASDLPIELKCESSTEGGRPSWLPKDQSVWLMSNPPYGGKGRIKGTESWKNLWEAALKKYDPEWAVGLGPERECKKGDHLGAWECLQTQKFLNGGLRVAASVWKHKQPKDSASLSK